MVSWQAFPSLPPRPPPRVSLVPKTPFPIPFKRLPCGRVCTQSQKKNRDCLQSGSLGLACCLAILLQHKLCNIKVPSLIIDLLVPY